MILVAGSANLDHVVRVERLPGPGETVLGGEYTMVAGGKGANQAVAAARAGGEVAFLGALGQDGAASVLLGSLEGSGVETRHVRRVAAPTGAAFIDVADNGENLITVVPGANALVAPADLPDLTGVTHLVLQLEIPLASAVAFAARARESRVRVVLNAAPAQALPQELLAASDVLVVNEHELRVVAGSEAGETADLARGLLARGPGAVIVTLGGRGSLAVTSDVVIAEPAFKVAVVDTVGAGDTFTGVLTTWLAEGQDLRSALRAASAAAALACTRPGAQASMPDRSEILALLAGPVSAG